MKIRKAVIPVAGKGTRFLPATKQIPKEMIPIINLPMIHYVVEEAILSGIEQVVFITSSGKQAIEDYFDRKFDLEDFLIKNGIDVKQSLRKPLNGVEIDIFSHKHRIGIEYNGNLYHTENYGRKDSNYHLNKTKIATNNNIKLIHIFEDEWENKRKIVENKLLHIFHINTGIKLHRVS